ncbi:MAG: diacylglycerol kinase family protein [Patescibacteria group bacterium]
MEELKQLTRAFYHAFQGIWFVWNDQRTFRTQVIIAIAVVILALLVGVNRSEGLLLVGVIGLVLSLELANTAIEKTIDALHPSKNSIIGTIKDIMAGAVLITATAAIIIGICIFAPYLL